MRRIVLALLGSFSMFASASSAQAQKSFISPDGQLRAFILPACREKGLENTENALEIRSSTGKLLRREAYSSPDCEHGMRVLRAEWTPDSQFFVFSTQFGGGRQPWHYLTQFYVRCLNAIRELDSYTGPTLNPHFVLIAPNTVETETWERPGPIGRRTVRMSLQSLVRCEEEKNRSGLFHSPNSGWISFAAGSETVQYGPYRLTQKYDEKAFAGQIYIQSENDNESRLIFTNQRALELLIGDRGELALINYTAATKDFEVYVANIRTGKSWRIDAQALRMYSRDSGADPSLVIVASGEAVSPDDQEALLVMNLIYISVSTREQAEQKGKAFKKWWYAVSTATGQVLREYRTPSVPHVWWIESAGSSAELPRR